MMKTIYNFAIKKMTEYKFKQYQTTGKDPVSKAVENPRNLMWDYLRRALKGDKNAQFQLGVSYLHGELGLDRNYEMALYWLNKAKQYGHHEAQRVLFHELNKIAYS